MQMDKITSKNLITFQKNNTNEFKDYEIYYKGSSLLKNIISNFIRLG